MPSGKEAMREWRRKNPEKNKEMIIRAKLRQEEKRLRSRLEKKERMMAGADPGSDYHFAGKVFAHGYYWNISYKENKQWKNLKVWCDGECEVKANYLLGYNGERFSESKDKIAMSEHRPEILKEIIKII